MPLLPDDCLVIVSSQLPVGSTRRLAKRARQAGRERLGFVYSPENLRLGQAIDVFTHPDRVIVGLERASERAGVEALLAPLSAPLVWMSLEAAEMTKHAINAFLATSITFMNEIARICEHVGADAKEVELGLKSEARIGPRAYLSPGAAFAGGTLARDVTTLAALADANAIPAPLVNAIRESNAAHRQWALGKLEERLGVLRGKTVAILGLTYKVGTSTLRRSSAIELAQALAARGARVVGYDPAVDALPPAMAAWITLAPSAAAAVEAAEGVVVATPWPEFRDLDWQAISPRSRLVVVDAGAFIAEAMKGRQDVAYAAVGRPWLDRRAEA
jgi:UDPglucose 6-dehydrogenase